MFTDQTEEKKPREQTKPAYHNPYDTSPYYGGVPPIPPPPPKQGHKGLIVVLVSLLCLVMVLGGGFITLFYQHSQKSGTATLPIATLTLTPSTTSGYKQELLASDFPTFIDGFRQALDQNDWQAVQGITDTGNFTEFCYMADSSCKNSWMTTSNQLTKKQLLLSIPSHYSYEDNPPVATICNHLEPEAGNVWTFVLGTYSQTADLIVPNDGPVTFGFQQSLPDAPWMWDNIFLNMPSCHAP